MARHAHRTDRADRTHRLGVDWTASRATACARNSSPNTLTLDEWGYPLLGEALLPPTTLKHARGAAADCPVLALKLATAQGKLGGGAVDQSQPANSSNSRVPRTPDSPRPYAGLDRPEQRPAPQPLLVHLQGLGEPLSPVAV